MAITLAYLRALKTMYLPEKTKGQGMVEYGLILVLVAIVAIVTLALVGDALFEIFDDIAGTLGLGGGEADPT
jgi:pilus assembly protein Flp/PilA